MHRIRTIAGSRHAILSRLSTDRSKQVMENNHVSEFNSQFQKMKWKQTLLHAMTFDTTSCRFPEGLGSPPTNAGLETKDSQNWKPIRGNVGASHRPVPCRPDWAPRHRPKQEAEPEQRRSISSIGLSPPPRHSHLDMKLGRVMKRVPTDTSERAPLLPAPNPRRHYLWLPPPS
jgi:hypothetical protein